MAAPVFSISEIVSDDGTVTTATRDGDDGTVGTAALEVVHFTEEEQSMPEGEWEMPGKHGYSRENYPGAPYDPVIQRLGANFDPQTITGIFNDVYMGPGAAKRMVDKLWRIHDRGNDLKIEHEDESFVAFMAFFRPAKITRSRWRYSITFEPLRRRTGTGPAAGVGHRPFSAAALRAPGDFRDVASGHVLDLRSTHDGMRSYQIGAGIFATVTAPLVALEAAMDRVDLAVGVNASLNDAPPAQTLLQLAGTFGELRAAARDVWTATASLSSRDSLAWQDGEGLLAFEEWHRTMASGARLAFLAAFEGEAEMRRRARPDAIRLHRTYSGEHLYDISIRYYGAASQWGRIRDRNDLSSLVMAGTEVLVIPQ